MRFHALVSVMATLLIGCGPDARGGGGGGGDDTATPDATEATPRQCNKMDIIFVVDDSGSMGEEQSNLATNFPMFAGLLSSYRTMDGEPIDFRVAVTTTGRDLQYTISLGGTSLPMSEQGDDGAFRDSCTVGRRWIEPTDSNMSQVLACRANVGTGGPSYEMPLLMTKWALAERLADGTNAGFLREDALLGVVMLTDEDDASTVQNNFTVGATGASPVDFHPADLISFLDTLKGHRSRWAAGVIAGPTDCSSSFGDAAKATRLMEFVTQANAGGGVQASFSSICDGDLTNALQKTLDTFQTACGVVIF